MIGLRVSPGTRRNSVTASDVAVVGGASGRNKALLVSGVEAEEVREILSGLLT